MCDDDVYVCVCVRERTRNMTSKYVIMVIKSVLAACISFSADIGLWSKCRVSPKSKTSMYVLWFRVSVCVGAIVCVVRLYLSVCAHPWHAAHLARSK